MRRRLRDGEKGRVRKGEEGEVKKGEEKTGKGRSGG